MALGIKRALGILLCLWKSKTQMRIYPVCRHMGTCYLPFSALPTERIRHPNETMSLDCCTLLCYLDNCSAVGVMAHNTLGSLTSLVFPQWDSKWGLSQPWLKRNWGKETLALTPLSTWTATWRRKGLSPAGPPLPASCCQPRGPTAWAVGSGAPAGDDRGQTSWKWCDWFESGRTRDVGEPSAVVWDT